MTDREKSLIKSVVDYLGGALENATPSTTSIPNESLFQIIATLERLIQEHYTNSARVCEHDNEAPLNCSCKLSCYCRTRTCKVKAKTSDERLAEVEKRMVELEAELRQCIEKINKKVFEADNRKLDVTALMNHVQNKVSSKDLKKKLEAMVKDSNKRVASMQNPDLDKLLGEESN